MDSAGNFVHFDVVPVATDHHFLRSNESQADYIRYGHSPVYLTIVKEWKSLHKDLPDSIYVQVYETRIDLLRAVIVGSAGTPYHDGLFFFDICLPSDYPNHPPKVHYRSHGYRLNPNLYANGTVCLSLINTWNGAREEKWTLNSTILQTLVSIQGLVLNERPYFNEPYYAPDKDSKCPRVINRSIKYNENAFILSCKTMMGVVRNPPRNFEGFVHQHFRARAGQVLDSVREYGERLRAVGWFGTNAVTSSVKVKKSRKVEANLKKVRSELLIVFAPLIPETIKMYGYEDEDEDEDEDVKKPKRNEGIWSKLIKWIC